ncbi:Dps family protein [Enterococcus timonensis]|uniref:Dps family protein n=1 Tax=Enterococcus timonensis TaxID=1852364 RepID=UPI0008D94600|nr:Dps family protein [Enterococcus timonensis]
MKYTETKKVLNQLVADLSQAVAVIHQAHWYMRGHGFMNLHPLMDTYMDQLNDNLDEISERLITLDGDPYSTLEEFAQHTGLKSQPGTWDKSMDDHIAHVVEVFRYLQGVFQKGIDASAKEGDDVTNDILIGAKTTVEKNIWMLQAQLGHAPEIDK